MVKRLICGLLCSCSLVYGQHSDTVERLLLNQGWEFAQSGTDKWMSAVVPGTVHQDLLRHQLLPDPFYGTNEKKIQWVENEDWEYKTTFVVTAEQLKRDGALLHFEGLDTYADVYLNGALLLKGDNMFVGYSLPVKPVLCEGENRLHVYFHSPIKQTLPQWNTNGFNYPADNDHHEKRVSVFSRKAPYSFGWDWGIRMVTSGIWRPVSLSFYDVATIDDYHVRQVSLSDQLADIMNEVEIESLAAAGEEAEIHILCSLKGEEKVRINQSVVLHPGKNSFQIPVSINNPIRWMPNGWGEATLYDFTTQVVSNQQVVAEKHHRIGLRTIRVMNEKDEDGESFYFEVNGVPMFAKGSNYIPQDALLPGVTAERYQTLFRDVKEANMNMIRVWGGGVYESDLFYDLADENGILVWQDFMFACTSYPSDPTFLQRVATEAEYNIRRLRNHASLAMWCGNNEILEGLKYWGWDKKYNKEVHAQMFLSYDKLFRELLPAKVQELDADRFYVHGSPYFANWGRPDSWGVGDSHNWGVWYGKKPFESSDVDIPRFMSEFGFQSFPEMKTIATFAAPKDYQIESEVMNAHQKSSIGNALIRTYMERDFRVPDNFEDFVYVGLVLQGHGIRHGFEAHRRNRPYCMGTMYWQLNDSWPVVSWSSIDYYGNWKALHYQAKRAFAPLLINPMQRNDSLCIYLLSDKLVPMQQLSMELKVVAFNGKVLSRREEKSIAIPANTSDVVFTDQISAFVTSEQRSNSFLQITLKDKSRHIVAEETHFFQRTKELELPQTTVSYKQKQSDGSCELIVTSPLLAKDVFIEVPIQGARFSDNFFDLLPGETKKIIVTSPCIRKNEKLKFNIKHIRETY